MCWASARSPGSGEVIHSGGRVLKNVTGLDLCKLLTGSHGTLGVITEITLKVLPAPEAVGTVVLPGLDAAAGVAALSAALGSPFSVSGAAWLPAEAARRVPGACRSRSFRRRWRASRTSLPSVSYRTAKLREHSGIAGAEILDDATSRAVWRAVRDLRAAARPMRADAVWRVSVRPSAGPAVLQPLVDTFGASGFLDWGGGLVWIAGPRHAAAHAAVEAAARAAGGTWTADARCRTAARRGARDPARAGAAGAHHPAREGGARSARAS